MDQTAVNRQSSARAGAAGRRGAIGAGGFLGVLAAGLIPSALWWVCVGRLPTDQLELSILGHAVRLRHLHHWASSKGVLAMTSVVGVFLGEAMAVGWRDSSLRRLTRAASDRSTRSDIAVYLSTKVHVFAALAVLTSGGLTLVSIAGLRTALVRATGVHLGLYMLPFAVQLPVCYLIYTFLDYWAHRASHAAWFWPLHRFHHAADDFCVLTAMRTHPADLAGFLISNLPLLLLGPSPEVLIGLALWVVYIRLWVHSRVRDSMGWVGATLIQTPIDHRLHHVRDISVQPAVNFALMPLWDRLFGTWRRAERADFAIGVDRDYRHGAWYFPDFWRDYREYLAGLRAGLLSVADRLGARNGRYRGRGDALADGAS